jgi:hypothetical protein
MTWFQDLGKDLASIPFSAILVCLAIVGGTGAIADAVKNAADDITEELRGLRKELDGLKPFEKDWDVDSGWKHRFLHVRVHAATEPRSRCPVDWEKEARRAAEERGEKQ